MDTIHSLLLYELRAIQLSPNDLLTRLRTWKRDVSLAQVAAGLHQLHKEGLVDGPGISAIHSLPVWLTAAGQVRARNLGGDLGGWRRVA